MVGQNVIDVVQDFFKKDTMLSEINNSLVVLIPEILNPTPVNHYRPIDLCNVIYKVISKIMVAKIRPLLDKIISPCQSTFVLGRWIGENQVIVKELCTVSRQEK